MIGDLRHTPRLRQKSQIVNHKSTIMVARPPVAPRGIRPDLPNGGGINCSSFGASSRPARASKRSASCAAFRRRHRSCPHHGAGDHPNARLRGRVVLLRPRIESGAQLGGDFIKRHERFIAMLADKAGFAHVAREQRQKRARQHGDPA